MFEEWCIGNSHENSAYEREQTSLFERASEKELFWGAFRIYLGFKEMEVKSTRVSGERCVFQKVWKGWDGEMCKACSYLMALSPGVLQLRPLLIQINGTIRHEGMVFQGE